MTKHVFKSGFQYGGMIASNYLAIVFLFAMAGVIMYHERRGYPDELFRNGCSANSTSSVDVCFPSAVFVNQTCQALCNEIEQCWFQDGSKCLVGGEVLTIMNVVLNSFVAFASSFVCLTSLAKSRLSAALFLEVIDHQDQTPREQSSEMCPNSAKGDIEFRDVDFRYASRDTQVLNHLNLTIHENEMLGIVGESGSGKSTILKLLLQLYSASSGSITWNGIDTSTISTKWLRDNISYVAQEPVLFSGTIRHNLMVGRAGCTEQEIVEAAKLVDADAFIRSFPRGYDTDVGELGAALSGGQKQRIAIARALLRRPRVLVLDEATSVLDAQTEAVVQHALETIRSQSKASGGSLSIVVVAHRLSTIRSCDRIVVVDEGHVVEEGTHQSLVNAKGVYAALYASQVTLGSLATPVQTESEAKEATQQDAAVESLEAAKEVTKKDEEEEEATQTMQSVSIVKLLRRIPKYQWMFWVSFLGNVFRAFLTPSYAYGSARAQELFYEYNVDAFWSDIWVSIWIIASGTVLTFIGSVLQWNFAAIVGERLIRQLRSEAFVKYLHMPIAFFDDPKHLPSTLTSRLSIDGRRVRDLIDRCGMLFENTLIVVICLIMCYSPLGEWRLSTLAILVSPLVLYAGYIHLLVVSNMTERIDNTLAKESGVITDCLLNIHTIHAYGLEDAMLASIAKDMAEADQLTKSRAWRGAVGQGVIQFIPTVFVLIVMSVGSWMISNGQLSYLQLFIVFSAVFSSAGTMGGNIAMTPSIQLAQRSAKNIMATLQLTSEDDAARAVKTEGQTGDIAFNNVSFAYPTRPEATILNSVSFTIPRNTSVAFVGASGCGKSTIIALIQRLYKPVSGTITLNGVDVETLNLDWYRSQLGSVNQEPCMFSGTIRENLVLGVDGDCMDQEIEEACNQALCMDFINEMPDRLETDLGAQGKAISGGQKQRLALARAILRKPSILLLDEATSALDSENQEKFLSALNAWRTTHPCTVITIAHRLSTIVESDLIFVIRDGIIEASGTHEELMSKSDYYVNLVQGQIETSLLDSW